MQVDETFAGSAHHRGPDLIVIHPERRVGAERGQKELDSAVA